MKISCRLLGAAFALSVSALAVEAATVNRVVMKASDHGTPGYPVVDPYLDWIGTGGVNEGVVGADSVANNGIDFKDSWVDSNWGLVETVRVSMYSAEREVAYLEFDAAGTTKSDFFDLANLTGSTWGTAGFPGQDPVNPFSSGQFFSIEGSVNNDRHWYVNNNWGGCGADRGWFVVLDNTTSNVCGWENTGSTALGANGRGFMYSILGGPGNFNLSSNVGVADVFAVSVTYDDGNNPPAIPVPGAAVLLASGLGGLGALRRRKKG